MTAEPDTFTPKFVTLLADGDGHARYVATVDATDVMNAYRQGGVFLLVTLDPEGNATVAFKPGRHWEASWSPPITLERR